MIRYEQQNESWLNSNIMGDSPKIVHWRPIPISPNNSLNTFIYSLVNWIWVPNVPSLLNVDQFHSAQIFFLLDNVYQGHQLCTASPIINGT